MEQPSLLWLFLSIPLIAIFAGVFGYYWMDLNTTYGPPIGTENISSFNRLSEINADLEAVKERTTTIKEDPSLIDRIGNYFSNAYSILVTFPKSFDIITQFLSISLLKLPLGKSGILISISIQTIFIAIVIIGIVFAILIKVKT